MRECGLVGAHARKRWRRGKANTAPAPDLIERDFTATVSNLKWVADVTEFRCADGKLYLAGILDLHDRGLAGWSMSERNNTDLVVNALVMALARREPDGELVHHADRGSPYTSLEFTNRLADWKLDASYGSTGDDNAARDAQIDALRQVVEYAAETAVDSGAAEPRAAVAYHLQHRLSWCESFRGGRWVQLQTFGIGNLLLVRRRMSGLRLALMAMTPERFPGCLTKMLCRG